MHAEKIEEKIGSGISGTVKNKTYTLSKLPGVEGMMIGVFENKTHLATFEFEDEIKQESKTIIQKLRQRGFELFIFTGDKQAAAEKVVADLGGDIVIKAEAKPEDKQKGIAD